PGAARREHRVDALQGRRPLPRVQAGRRGSGDRELPGRVAAGAQPPGRRRGRSPDAALGAGLPVRQLHVPGARHRKRGADRGRRYDHVGAADLRSVALILRETRAILQRARELIPEHRKTLEGLPARLSQSDALSQLLQALDEAAIHPTEGELSDLFQELRPDALSTLMVWVA